MAPHTTPTTKACIFTLKDQGVSNEAIRLEFGCSESTIHWIYRKHKSGCSLYTVTPGQGRLPKIDNRGVRLAIGSLCNGTAWNATQLRNLLFPNIQVPTLRRLLCKHGLGAYQHCAVPFISKINRTKQLRWAEVYAYWTVENWKQVLFLDELIFCLFGSNGREWYWRIPAEGLDPKFMQKTVKHGGGKVTILGDHHTNWTWVHHTHLRKHEWLPIPVYHAWWPSGYTIWLWYQLRGCVFPVR